MLRGDSLPITNLNYYNRSIWHIFPLLTNMLATWVCLIFFYIHYPCGTYTWTQTVELVLAIMMIIVGSIDAAH